MLTVFSWLYTMGHFKILILLPCPEGNSLISLRINFLIEIVILLERVLLGIIRQQIK